MDKLTDMPQEENPDSFTLEDWDRAKGQTFKIPQEVVDQIHSLMRKAHELSTQHGVPFLALGVAEYDDDSYHTFCSSNLAPLGRIPPELLAIYSCANNGYRAMLQVLPEINTIMFGSPEMPKSGLESLLDLLSARRDGE